MFRAMLLGRFPSDDSGVNGSTFNLNSRESLGEMSPDVHIEVLSEP
jgi:hypothetical protein